MKEENTSPIHKPKRRSLPKKEILSDDHLCSNCVDIPPEDARPEDVRGLIVYLLLLFIIDYSSLN